MYWERLRKSWGIWIRGIWTFYGGNGCNPIGVALELKSTRQLIPGIPLDPKDQIQFFSFILTISRLLYYIILK